MAPLGKISLLATMLLMTFSVVKAEYDDPNVTLRNWPQLTKGKRVLTKYFDPFCEICQDFQNRIWSKIEEKYKDDPEIVILEVNCQSHFGLQMCIERNVDDTPELHWGDSTVEHKYEGTGDLDVVIDFIENNLRKPSCSIAFPEACPEEDREDMVAIEKLTVEYLKEINKFDIDKPEKYGHQSAMKFGIKNPFVNDYDDLIDEDEDFIEEYSLTWEGMPVDV